MADESADVRVKLSAEGVAEVVAAFQKIASEAKKSGKDAAGAFTDLGKQFDEIGKKLAGLISIGLIAEKFDEFFKATLEGVDAMETLSRQTGVSTDAIQAFGRAARDAGIGQEAVNNALARFTTAVGRAEIGSKQSADALGDLGISVKAIANESPDQKLLAVSKALSQIQDPARRARDEVALFSRAGVDFDQVLVKVGQEGLAPFIAELQRMGLYLDGDTIAALDGALHSFRDMHDEIKGLASELLIGLAPALQAATDQLVKTTQGDGISGLQTLGQWIGVVLNGIVLVIETVGKGIAASAALISNTFVPALAASAQFMKGDFSGAAEIAGATLRENIEIAKSFGQDVAHTAVGLFSPPPKPQQTAPSQGGTGPPPEQQTALARAQLQLTEAKLDSELALYKAHAALLEAIDKAAYDQGALALQDYYERRAQIISAELDKEIATAQAKRSAVASQPVGLNDDVGRVQQQTELARLDGELAQLQIQRTSLLLQNTNEQSDAQRKLYADTLKAEQSLLTIEGRRADAARVKLAADLADLDQQLRKGGVSDSDRSAAEGKFVGEGNAQIDFTDQAAQAQAALASLETAQKGLQDQVKSGELFSIDADQKILALDRERLPALQAQAQALLDLAKATGDAEDVSKAEAYKQKIDELTASTKTLAQQTAEFKLGVENALGAGITKFFQDAEQGAKGFKNAFHDMAAAIEQDLLQIANKILEQAVLNQIFNPSGAGGSGSASTGGFLSFLTSLFGSGSSSGVGAAGDGATPGSYFATGGSGIGSFFSSLFSSNAAGGQIRGPGTGTSDSIPMWASDGEFVVNARATQSPGVLQLLQAINDGNMIHRASGGLVNSVINPSPVSDDGKNGRFTPGVLVTNNFHIQAPHGSISRPTQKQIGARAYKSIMRAHQANN